MPRPIWKGHVSFGLVNIPVVLHSAEQANELHFRMLDRRDRAPIKYERRNASTGEPVAWDDIVKGYPYDEANFVLLSDEDFKQAAVEASQTVEIQDFVDAAAISPMYYDKPYYLAPVNKGEKGYALLRETLRRTKKVGVATVVLRTRQYVGVLLPVGKVLVLNLLRFHEELRSADDLPLPGEELAEYKITDRELAMAEQLVESMTGLWEPEKYRDEYRDKLLHWIEQKARSGELSPTSAVEAPEEEPGPVVNIMDLLQKSLEKKKAARLRTDEDEGNPRGGRRADAAAGARGSSRKAPAARPAPARRKRA